MKHAKLLNFLLIGLCLATAATGCKKNPKNITPITSPRAGLPGNEGLSAPITGPGNSLSPGGAMDRNLSTRDPGAIADPLLNAEEDRSSLSAQSVYFDFDRSAIKTSEQGKLDQVATYMKSTAGVQLKIEGNCDERGTEEYNRSLGERRAIAARDYLIQKHGIESGRITTMSNGEDRPKDLGKTEEAYAQNRRDDFVILKPRNQ